MENREGIHLIVLALTKEAVKVIDEMRMDNLEGLLKATRKSECKEAIALVEEAIVASLTINDVMNDKPKQ